MFSMIAPVACVGTSCSLTITFDDNYKEATLEGNALGLFPNRIIPCITTTRTIATVTYSTISAKTIITPVPGFLDNIGADFDVPILSCLITFPIEEETFIPRSRPIATLTRIVQPTTPEETITETEIKTQMTLPFIAPDEIITLIPQVCRVGIECTYRFEISPYALATYPAIHFTSSFPGTWSLANRDYCIFSQVGTMITLQVINNYKYNRDRVPYCTLNVIPLEQNTVYDPTVGSNVIEIGEYEYDFSHIIPNLDLHIYHPKDPSVSIPYLIATPQPIQIFQTHLYEVHPLFPLWVVVDIPAFHTVQSNPNSNVVIFNPDLGGEEELPDGGIPYYGPHIDVASVPHRYGPAIEVANAPHRYGPAIEVASNMDGVFSTTQQISTDGSTTTNNETEGNDNDAGDDDDDEAVVVVDKSIENANKLYAQEKRYTVQADADDEDAVLATKGEESPVTRISIAGNCLATTVCNVQYQFLIPSYLKTIKFTNHFDITDPRSTFDCIDTSSGRAIGKVTYSPDLKYGFLRSNSASGFLQTKCIVGYHINSSRSERRVTHRYEFVGNTLNTDDVNTTYYTPVAISDAFILPSYSSHSLTVHASLIQGHSKHNYVILKLETASETSTLIALETLHLNFDHIDTSIPLNEQEDDGAFDFIQVECNIPPISSAVLQPTCRGVPTPRGILITFSSTVTNHNIEYITVTWSLANFRTPFMLPRRLVSAVLGYQRDNTESSLDKQSHIELLPEFHVFPQGQDFAPIVYHGSHDVPCPECNIYLPRDSTTDFYINFGAPLKPGNIIVLRVFSERKGDIEQHAHRVVFTSLDGSLLSEHKLPHLSCQYCAAWDVQADVPNGLLHFTVTSNDSYNSLTDQTRKLSLEVIIKTPLPAENYLPNMFENQFPVKYQPAIETTYFYTTPQWWVLYDYRSDSNQVTRSERGGKIIDGVQTGESVTIVLPTRAPLDSENLVNPSLRGDVQRIRYRYKFEGCHSWVPVLNHPLHSCVETGEISYTVKTIECTAPDVANNAATIITSFAFNAPTEPRPSIRCSMTTTIDGDFRASKSTTDPKWAAFEWSFKRRVTFPRTIAPASLSFPQHAIPCNNINVPFFIASGPGLYTVRLPSGYTVPTDIAPAKEYSIENVSATQLTIRVGSHESLQDPVQVYDVVSIYLPLTCGINDDISKFNWKWSYKPFRATSYNNRLSVTRTDQDLFAELGYEVVHGSYELINEAWDFMLSGSVVRADKHDHVLTGVMFFTSVRKNTQFELTPPSHVQFPPFGYSGGKYLREYTFPAVQINPNDNTVSSYMETIPLSLQYHPTDPLTLVMTFEEDLYIYSVTDYKMANYDKELAPYIQNGKFVLDETNPPQIGGYFDLGFPAAITDYVDVKQCFRNLCSRLGQINFDIRPQLNINVDLRAQVNQEVYGSVSTSVSLVVGDLIVIELLEQDDEAIAAIPSLKIHPFSWEDPTSHAYQLYSTTPNRINIRIARPIPLNTPLALPLRAISVSDDLTDIDGTDDINYSRFESEEAINFRRYVQYQATLVQEHFTTTAPVTVPVNLDVRPLIHSFTLDNGYHIDDVITFTFSIRDDLQRYQDVFLLGLPLDILPTSRYTSPQGYPFDLSTQSHGDQVGLLIRSRHPYPIPTDTPITITFPTPNLPQTQIGSKITQLHMSSISGIGIYNIAVQNVHIDVDVEILARFSAVLSIVGAPLTDQTPPFINEYKHKPVTPCVAPSNNVCFLRLDIMDGESNGVFLPATGVSMSVDFLEYKINYEPTLPHHFPEGTVEEYHTPDGSRSVYTIHRDYSQLEANNKVIFTILPISGADDLFTHVTIPISFLEYNIISPLSINAYDIGTGHGIFTTAIRGPSVYPSTAPNTHFFYLNGGSYVNEPLSIGITDLNLIQELPSSGNYDSRAELEPKAYFARGSFNFGSDNEFDLFEEIGLKSLNTKDLISSNVSPINRMFNYSPDMTQEFFGICALETIVDVPTAGNTPPQRSINFHIQALSSFSENEVISLGFTSIIPTKPINIGYKMTNPWEISTYTNRYFFESLTQQPLISYNDKDRVTNVVPIGGYRLEGFKIRPRQWLRMIPSIPTIDISPAPADNISNTPTTTLMSLIIQQQWPKQEEIDHGTYADEWQQYELKPDDAVHIIIPPFYTIPVGVYHCDDTDAYLEWAITMFIFHPARFKFPRNNSTESSIDSIDAAPSYRCEFPISVTEANYKRYVLDDVTIGQDAELTLSIVRVSTLDNSDDHLPFLSSTDKSPLLTDQDKNISSEGYFEWFMPMPVEQPRYNIDFNDMSTVGVQYDAQLTITNGYLQNGRSLYYPLESFPIKFSTDPTSNGFSDSCYDDNGRDIATIHISPEYGIEFLFVNPYATKTVTCTFKFTPTEPLEHGGLTLHSNGLLRTVSKSNFDHMQAYTTINVRSTDPLIHLTSLIVPHPTLTIKADFIPGLVTRVHFSGKYYSFESPSYIDGDFTKPVNASILGIGPGLNFRHHHDFIDPDEGLFCLTSSGQPFAAVKYSYARSNLAEDEEVDEDDEDDTIAVEGAQLQLHFLFGLIRSSEWTCYIDIIAVDDVYTNVPNARFIEHGKPSIIMADYIDNQITFTPRSFVDLALSHNSETAKTMGTIGLYYNSTTVNLINDPKPAVIQFTTPRPFLSLPQFGLTCYLNGVRYDDIPLRPYSFSASRSVYTIATHIFVWPTQTGLAHVTCTIPSLSIVSHPISNLSVLYFSDTYSIPFTTPSVPEIVLLQQQVQDEDEQTIIPFASNSWFTGEEITPVVLNAYQETQLLFNITNADRLQPLDLFSAAPLQWSLSQSNECVSTLHTSNNEKPVVFYSNAGLAHPDVGVIVSHVIDRDIAHDQCAFTVFGYGFHFDELPDKTCDPESAQGCSIETSIYSRFSSYIPRLYKAKVNFAPFFRPTTNITNVYDLGAVGSIDYEFSGYNTESSFLVQLRSTSNRFMFIAQVGVLDSFGNIIISYQFNTDAQISNDKRDHIIRVNDDNSSGCDIIIGGNPRWDQLSRLRIAYIGTNIEGSLSITVSKTTLSTYPSTDPTFTPHKFTTNNLQQPKDDSTLPISTSNSRRFNKPIASITAPFEYGTTQLGSVVRGAIHHYTLTVHGVTPLLEALPDIELLQIHIPSQHLNAASLEVDFHITSPNGASRVLSSNPNTPRVTAIMANCLDLEFSGSDALASIAFGITYSLTENVPTNIQLVSRAYFNTDNLRRYLDSKKTNQLKCQFVLAFTAPSSITYSTAQAVSSTWNVVPPPNAASIHELMPNYLYGVQQALYTSRGLSVYDHFADQKVYMATLDEGATSMNGYGTLEISSYGHHTAVGDVFIIKFIANKEKFAKYDNNSIDFTSLEDFKKRKQNKTNVEVEEDALSTPIDQPYRFSPIPVDTPYCYDRLFASSNTPIGMLYPADPMTYSSQLGTYSDTFLLKITKESRGATYSSFSCQASLLSLTTVPFEGIIQLQHLTAREYEVLVTSTTPDLIALGFSQVMRPHTTELNIRTGLEEIIYDDLNLNTNRLSRYTYNTNDGVQADELRNMGTVLRSCTDALEHPEQTRFCLVPTGVVKTPISQGILLRVESEDVSTPLEPVSITFIISFNPRPEGDVHFQADLSAIKFAAFFGCDNFPTASFYGESYTGIDEGILKVTITDSVITTSSEVSIKCNFLSSRYIQPSYYLPNNNGIVIGRSGINIPMKLQYHDKHHTQILRTGYTGSFLFKSTIRNDISLIPAINFIVDRKSNKTVTYSSSSSSESIKQQELQDTIGRAYLSGGEVDTLISWFSETTLKSIFVMTEDTTPLFYRMNSKEIFISQQTFLEDTNDIHVQLALPATELQDSHLHYALPFKSATDWLSKADSEFGLKFNSEKMITNFIQKNKNDLAIQDQYLSLTPLIQSHIGLFNECQAGQCGGNCQPCNWSAPCYNSADCGFGLYCKLVFADLRDEIYNGEQVIRYTASSITGQQHTATLKAGMYRSNGVCTMIDHDAAALDAQTRANEELLHGNQTDTHGHAHSYNKPTKTHTIRLSNRSNSSSRSTISNSNTQSRLSSFIRDPAYGPVIVEGNNMNKNVHKINNKNHVDPDVATMTKVGANILFGRLNSLNEHEDVNNASYLSKSIISLLVAFVLSFIMM